MVPEGSGILSECRRVIGPPPPRGGGGGVGAEGEIAPGPKGRVRPPGGGVGIGGGVGAGPPWVSLSPEGD
jgi:hypothetical protein